MLYRRKRSQRMLIFLLLLLLSCSLAGSSRAQQPGTTGTTTYTPAPSSNATTAAPSQNTSGANQAPSVAPSANTPPGSAASPANAQALTPQAEAQASAQPGTPGPQQSGSASQAAGSAPQAPAAAPVLDVLPGEALAPQTGTQAPASGITSPQNANPPGRESVPSPAPQTLRLTVPPVAANFRAAPAPLPDLGRIGVDMDQQKPLSLREAIQMALANNKDIEIGRENVRSAEFDLKGAHGAYDPRLSSLSYYERIETPISSFLSGGTSGAVTQTDFTSTARLEGLVRPGGGGYRIDFSSIRLSTDNQFAALNPQYPTALTFNYTQPLLRGLRFDANRRQIEIAKKNLSMTDSQFRQRAIETIASVQSAYWDLVFALRNLQIQRDAVNDARTQLKHNKRLVSEGQLAPIDVVSAEAQVSGFEESVYSAQESVGRAENTLKNLIVENRQSPLWGFALVPVDDVDVKTPVVDLQELMREALDTRPELQQSDVQRQINELDQRLARDEIKPQVDLVGSYGVSGLAGTLNVAAENNPFNASTQLLTARVNQLSSAAGLPPVPVIPTAVLPDVLFGGYGQSLLNLGENRFKNYRVGVQMSLPLRNRAAEAQLGRALVDRDRIRTQREQLEQLIQVDVRNALQTVRTAESRLRAAAAARSASEQQYASEQRKFDAGQSTLFLVLDRQTALTTARGNELRAQTDLNKAAADLERAAGNSLEQNHVIIRSR